MNMNEEKRILESYGKLSRKNQLVTLAVITGMAAVEENARRTVREALAKLDPQYASREPVPMEEAVNG